MGLLVGGCRRRRDAGSLTGWVVQSGLGRLGGGASARRGGTRVGRESGLGSWLAQGSLVCPSYSTPVRLSKVVAADCGQGPRETGGGDCSAEGVSGGLSGGFAAVAGRRAGCGISGRDLCDAGDAWRCVWGDVAVGGTLAL